MIVKKRVSDDICTISDIAAQTYTGKALMPAVTVSWGGTALRQGKDYRLDYNNNIKAKTATVKYSKLKKKAQTLAVTKVIKFTKKLNDKKTYTLVSAKKRGKSFKKYFKVNKTTGKVTVKKGLKKGTYKVKIKVKAAGNSNYNPSEVKAVTFTAKVK